MQQDAIDCATDAIEKYNIENDIAVYIGKTFNKMHNPTWNVIVGRNFGIYTPQETEDFISLNFLFGDMAFLIYKSG